VLRARFPVRDRRPVQEVPAPGPTPIPVRDLAGLDGGARDAAAAARVRELAALPFDLQAGPIHRVELLALAQDEHLLLCVFHHIAFDGWSMSVFARELARSYDRLLGTDGATDAHPVARYADCALWQRQLAEQGAFGAQIDYWREVLSGPLPALELPAGSAAGAAQPAESATLEACAGARCDVVLPPETHAALLELGRSERATLFMTLASAFTAFLGRLSGAQDILLGTLVSGRSHPATEEAIGLFANSLVLRSDLSGDPSFREHLQRTRRMALGAYANADVPFEVLVRELKPPMVLGRNPYFDVVFQLRNLPEARAAAGELTFEEVAVDPGFARFDLLVEAFEEEGRVHTRFEYRRERFGDELMATWVERWRALLAAAASRPDARLSELSGD